MKKRPVPTHTRCEPTIKREARYWARAFRGLLTREDLENDAWEYTLKKVLPAYDPMRDVTIETYLTLSLRRHFRRMIKRTLTRAFLYRVEQHDALTNSLRDEMPVRDAMASLNARLMLRKLATFSQREQALARLLIKYDGKVVEIARALGWSNRDAYQRVAALRTALRRGGS